MKNFIRSKQINKKNIKLKRIPRFQLLEVMVAIFLILVCAAPSLNINISLYLAQQKMIRKNQRDHLVHLVYASVVEKLYKNEIPIETLLKEETEIIPFEDAEKDPALSVKQQIQKLNYSCQYYFKKKEDEKKEKLVQLFIKMNDLKKSENDNDKDEQKDYHYLIYISLKDE